MRTVALAVCLLTCLAGPAAAQRLDPYLEYSPLLRPQIEALAAATTRSLDAIRNVLPAGQPAAFAAYASEAPTFRRLLDEIDAQRLNKMVANAPGASGTALVSRVAVPAVLGAAIEYGSILQQTTGTTTTLRGNLLGVARLVAGGEQFAYCPPVAGATCSSGSRRLRMISGSVAFEDTKTASAEATTDPVTAASLIGDDYRVRAWSVRVDLTPSNNLDDPSYSRDWSAAIDGFRNDRVTTDLTAAISALFSDGAGDVYDAWVAETLPLLQSAVGAPAFYDQFDASLAALVARLQDTDTAFLRNVAGLRRAYANYFAVRDRMLEKAQSNKASLEFTNHRPLDQPQTSNLRLIYSHQPTRAPSVMTFNAGLSWYDDDVAGTTASKLRDVQLAGQIDRPLGAVGALGPASLTIAGYYQWMKADALIAIGEGTTVPGTGIELPATAAAVLGTKGHIGVAQAKLSFSLSDVLKVPFSITWASRRELIKEKDVRGQVGLTVDLDQVLH